MIRNNLKKGLGRGLSSLLGDSDKKIDTNKIAIKDIGRNKFQPRKIFKKISSFSIHLSRKLISFVKHC